MELLFHFQVPTMRAPPALNALEQLRLTTLLGLWISPHSVRGNSFPPVQSPFWIWKRSPQSTGFGSGLVTPSGSLISQANAFPRRFFVPSSNFLLNRLAIEFTVADEGESHDDGVDNFIKSEISLCKCMLRLSHNSFKFLYSIII